MYCNNARMNMASVAANKHIRTASNMANHTSAEGLKNAMNAELKSKLNSGRNRCCDSEILSENDSEDSNNQFLQCSEDHFNDEVKLAKSKEENPTAQNTIVKDGDKEFLKSIMELIFKECLVDTDERNSKVCEFYQPQELLSKMGDLKLGEAESDTNKLLDFTETIVRHSVKTSHPRFFNQLFGGLSLYSVGGAWVSEAVNASLYTYEVAPVFTLMEREVYTKMLKYVGFEGGEAIFAPGGSISNLYAVNVARHKKFPQIKTKGMHAIDKIPCLFASEKAHYSTPKAAAALGLGSENVILVKADNRGKMLTSDLREKVLKAKAEGKEPFMVVATAGTTVFGAYDPISEIVPVCREHDMWLHVDGAWGGSVALSKTYKYLIKDIEQADSMTWNAHKLMGVSQQCSVFLCKHKGILQSCHSANAQYLFQQDKHYDVSYDTGDMSLQCGRKNDVLKLWMQWKAIGDVGMEMGVDHIFGLSRYLAHKIKTTPGFRLLMDPMCTNVCFWYIPVSMRGQEETDEWWQKIAKVTVQIKAGMMQDGTMMITYNPEGKLVNFFRMVITNRHSTEEDMDFVVDEIVRLGKDL